MSLKLYFWNVLWFFWHLTGKGRGPGNYQQSSGWSQLDIKEVQRVEAKELWIFPGHLWVQRCSETSKWSLWTCNPCTTADTHTFIHWNTCLTGLAPWTLAGCHEKSNMANTVIFVNVLSSIVNNLDKRIVPQDAYYIAWEVLFCSELLCLLLSTNMLIKFCVRKKQCRSVMENIYQYIYLRTVLKLSL